MHRARGLGVLSEASGVRIPYSPPLLRSLAQRSRASRFLIRSMQSAESSLIAARLHLKPNDAQFYLTSSYYLPYGCYPKRVI